MKVFVAVVGGHPTRARERSRTSPWREGGGGPRAGRCEEGPGVSGWSAGRSERCWAGRDLARESGWPLRQGLSRSLVWWGHLSRHVCAGGSDQGAGWAWSRSESEERWQK